MSPTSVPDRYFVSLKVALINPNNEVLGLKAREDGALSGFYDLPGGRINADEFMARYEDLITRELKEEVGERVQWTLDNHPLALGGIWAFGRKTAMFLFYSAQHFTVARFRFPMSIRAGNGFRWTRRCCQHILSGHLQLLRKFLEL